MMPGYYAAFGVDENEQFATVRPTHRNQAIFQLGVGWIRM